MPYTGTDPDLIDLQNQITSLQISLTAHLAGLQTQIKQVTLTLEGELATITAAFTILKNYVEANISS